MNDCEDLRAMSAIGFGSYRVVRGTAEHHAALAHALALGCTLIDTASNYADGKSEQLVGDVLAAHPRFDPFVVTKVGYISPSTQRALAEVGVAPELLRRLSPESHYSLDADVIRAQIGLSQSRLRRSRIDAVLLHNPEHLFERITTWETGKAFEATIVEAFTVLEEAVAAGAIGYYGVSSNVLPSSPANAPFSFERFHELASAVTADHHFRIVEFPFNLIEREAALPNSDGKSLIDRVRAAGCISLGNRPLNARSGETAIRLASYDDEPVDQTDRFDELVELVQRRLSEAGEPYSVDDFPIMRFLRDSRHGIEHPDTVDEIFNRHLYPFIARLWEDDVPTEVRISVASLQANARSHARQALSRRAEQVQSEFAESGLIPGDGRELALAAVEFGLRSGIDHVLVGMRSTSYVERLRRFFMPEPVTTRNQSAPMPLVRASSISSVRSRAIG